MNTIGIIGCGNLGLSLLNGIRKNDPSVQIIASRRNTDSFKNWKDKNTRFTSDNMLVLEQADILILALKPYTLLSTLEELKSHFDAERHTLISVATGIQISEIKAVIGTKIGIFRAMPNTAAGVNESITALCSQFDPLQRKSTVEKIFQSIGETIWLDETLMESATILGACGIAYVLRFIRAMIQGGIEVGFDAQTASKIVAQTVKGAATLLIENKSHPEQEIDRVTTPKGCTIVGLNTMEHSGFSSALIRGIVSSYEKIER